MSYSKDDIHYLPKVRPRAPYGQPTKKPRNPLWKRVGGRVKITGVFAIGYVRQIIITIYMSTHQLVLDAHPLDGAVVVSSHVKCLV